MIHVGLFFTTLKTLTLRSEIHKKVKTFAMIRDMGAKKSCYTTMNMDYLSIFSSSVVLFWCVSLQYGAVHLVWVYIRNCVCYVCEWFVMVDMCVRCL